MTNSEKEDHEADDFAHSTLVKAIENCSEGTKREIVEEYRKLVG